VKQPTEPQLLHDLSRFLTPTGLGSWRAKLVVAMLACYVWNPAQAEREDWAIAYEGKEGRFFFDDPKVVRLIVSDLGIPEKGHAMSAFRGVPNPVNVIEGRYVSSSSCQPHECPFNRGFFWLDAATGETLAARNTVSFPKNLEYRENGVLMLREYSALTIGGSAPSVSSISPTAMQAMRSWIVANELRFDRVQYRSGAKKPNSPVTLDPSEYSSPAGHAAAGSGTVGARITLFGERRVFQMSRWRGA
jgi:hypothetical protein